VVIGVTIADILEVEVAIESNEPTSEAEEKFRERRMHVKIVFSCDVVGRKFSKMNFVEPRSQYCEIKTR